MGGLLCLVSRTGHQNIHYTRAFHAICKDAYGVGYLTIGDLVAFVVVKPFECPHVLWRKLTYGKLFLGNCGYRHYIGTQISHGKSFLPYAAMIVITPLGMVISCSVENVNSLCLSLRLFTFPCGFDSRTVDLIKSPFQGRASLTWHPSGSRRLAPRQGSWGSSPRSSPRNKPPLQTLAMTLGFVTVHWTVTLSGSTPVLLTKQKSPPQGRASLTWCPQRESNPPLHLERVPS